MSGAADSCAQTDERDGSQRRRRAGAIATRLPARRRRAEGASVRAEPARGDHRPRPGASAP